ncbi:hypothetical protein CGUA_12625 [Corynebacterium guangdongense]|nr:hypothetical protein CGUA_12625 [Corynebacterium guangdongense]
MLALLLTGATACSPATPTVATVTTTAEAPASVASAASGVDKPALPPETHPEAPAGKRSWQECPYLDTAWVEQTNGQRVTAVGLDDRFPTPACVYWSYPEAPQLQVLVRTLPDQDTAIAVVDHFAPVDSTELAELPGGWTGGRGPTPGGAVFAVFRDTVAVVVLTNQGQSFKAEQVARETIANLGF